MVIIELSGGLGNQMFQYALYKQLKADGKEVKIDDFSGYKEETKRVPSLGMFGINYNKASEQEVINMRDAKMDIFSRIRR
ncbi:MAG: alpha-1,2-fucosyltransferase, partial [Butyrivibrio sp.]|nr:alpha-1,2-fucosyltransferase [Butyrivibrio sp.]